jgi:hypothetical protein
MRLVPALVVLVALGPLAGASGRTVAANGVQLEVPQRWQRVEPADPGNVIDPRTLLVVGTPGVHHKKSRCQVAAYTIPPAGAVVVLVGWKKDSGGQKPGRAPLAKLVAVHRPSFECFSGRGAVASLVLGGKPYQVNVLVGDRASKQRVRAALAVARSFDLVR